MKTKAKTRIPEIARNHVPSGIKPPTPAIGSQTATVMRDGIVFLHTTYTQRSSGAKQKNKTTTDDSEQNHKKKNELH